MKNELKNIVTSPIVLAPNRVWRFYQGGRMIETLQRTPSPKDSHFPEEWVGSTVQASNPCEHFREGEGLAVVSKGLSSPVTLKDIMSAFPEEMLGTAHVSKHGSNSALLVKLLDAAIRLIIHAHPNKDFAKKHLHSCFGKTEAWFVLETRPEVENPYVLIAFKEEVNQSQYTDILKRQDLETMIKMMHRVPVKAGDVVYVKPGVPHAIGEGIFMVELQEPTDFSIILEQKSDAYTFREEECYLGLSPELALSNLDYSVYSWSRVEKELVIKPRLLREQEGNREYELLGYNTTECFAGHRIEVSDEFSDNTNDRSSILIVLDGEGVLKHHNGVIPLKRGMELFVPAALKEYTYTTPSGLKLFKSLPALS